MRKKRRRAHATGARGTVHFLALLRACLTPLCADRNHILDWVHPEECNHLAAMVRAVREAPPNSAPAVAHLRVLRKPSHDAEPWLWAEMKLSSDVRAARPPRARGYVLNARPCIALTQHVALCSAGRVPLPRGARRHQREGRGGVAARFPAHNEARRANPARGGATQVSLTAPPPRLAATTCARPATA